MLITIFTPSYNRARLLHRLFDSLCRQECKDFEWLIVDDGSTDSTADDVESFRAAADFPVVYKRKDNGGKHTAHNLALQWACGKYIFTVDSDDWLPDDCIASIRQIITEKHDTLERDDICGIIGLKALPTGEIISGTYAGAPEIANLYQLENLGYDGERFILFKTEVARRYPFPVIDGEKFLSENVIYARMALKYCFVVVDKTFAICEYQPDGLSRNFLKLMMDNPGGCMMQYAQRIDTSSGFRQMAGYIVRYNAFCWMFHGDKTGLRYAGRHKTLVAMLKPLGIAGALYYRLKVSRIKN